jgi:hypothetical protein
MAIATAAQVRAYIRGLSSSTTAEDTTLDTLIARCDSVFASYLGFGPPWPTSGDPTIEDTSYTLILDGPGGRALRLPVYPIQSVTSIHDAEDRLYSSADLIPSGDYTVYGDEGIVYLDDDGTTDAWSKVKRGIKVVAVLGWATIPDSIVHACCLQVAHWYNARDHIGRTNISQGGGSIAVRDLGLLPEVKEALAAHRLATAWVA